MYKSDNKNTENYGKLSLEELIQLDIERLQKEVKENKNDNDDSND